MLRGNLRLAISLAKSTTPLRYVPVCSFSSRHPHHRDDAHQYVEHSQEYMKSVNSAATTPDKYWNKKAEGISWAHPYAKVLDTTHGVSHATWFSGGRLNMCHNALDRHVLAGHGNRVAVIYDSPVTQTVKKITYAELLQQVKFFASALRNQGVVAGDRVLIYMPMIPEAIVAMLACARLGAIHSVVFGGFAAPELAARIDDASPKVIVAASCGMEGSRPIAYKPLLDGAIAQAKHKPEKCIVYQRKVGPTMLNPKPWDIDWNDALKNAQGEPCHDVDAQHPLYILYTSGTTGSPKGVVRPTGGHAVALNDSMSSLFGINAGDVWWAASDIGWVVGHSYIVYAPLLAGATTVMYEGKPVGTPDPGAFFRVIAEHNVKSLFTAPTVFRAIKREDPQGKFISKYAMKELKYLFLAGERLDPDTQAWTHKHMRVPVYDNYWQTETGSPMLFYPHGMGAVPPNRPGSAGLPVPGWDIRVLHHNGRQCAPGEFGDVVAKLPLPPGALSTLWKNDERFVKSYLTKHPGYYETADAGYQDKDGYVYIMTRTDDVINVAGHRLSTGQMEEVISSHSAVAECAVLRVADSIKGEVPVAVLVLKMGETISHKHVGDEVVTMIRSKIGPVAALKKAIVVDRLPKTRSGKILRNVMSAMAAGQSYRVPPTIDEPAVLIEIESVFALHFPKHASTQE